MVSKFTGLFCKITLSRRRLISWFVDVSLAKKFIIEPNYVPILVLTKSWNYTRKYLLSNRIRLCLTKINNGYSSNLTIWDKRVTRPRCEKSDYVCINHFARYGQSF
uniref:Uncharacterized protein n=1 Tax=Cacopsylla melanoneura TaxID=428564 RepID=A0A8D8ZBQ0_9HEMI